MLAKKWIALLALLMVSITMWQMGSASSALAQAALPNLQEADNKQENSGKEAGQAALERIRAGIDQIADTITNQPKEVLIRKGAYSAGVLLLIFFLRWLAGYLTDRIVGQLQKHSSWEKGKRRLIKTESILRKSASSILVIIGFAAIAQIWGMDIIALIVDDVRIAGNLITIILILSLGFLAWFALNKSIEFFFLPRVHSQELSGNSARTQTLIPLMQGVTRITVFTFTMLLLLSELGLNITPLLAGAGIIGLAIGFGSQTLVKDFLTGAMILIEDAMTIGDFVQIAGHEGRIEQMRMRTAWLRDLEGVVHVVPYSEIKTIKNYAKEHAFAVMDIGVAYREDVDNVMKVITEVGAALREQSDFKNRIVEELQIMGLDRFEDSAVIIRARIKTKPLEQWNVRRAFNKLLKKRFDEEGIEIPFPHRTLYLGHRENQGSAALEIRQGEKKEPEGGKPEKKKE